MQPKDGHIDENWKNDETESPGKEMRGQISLRKTTPKNRISEGKCIIYPRLQHCQLGNEVQLHVRHYHGNPDVTQKVPEILDGHETDQSDDKETNPFDTECTGQEHPR